MNCGNEHDLRATKQPKNKPPAKPPDSDLYRVELYRLEHFLAA